MTKFNENQTSTKISMIVLHWEKCILPWRNKPGCKYSPWNFSYL